MESRNPKALSEEVQEALMRAQPATIEEGRIIIDEIVERRNAMPRDEFHGLSPEQMYGILYLPFECPELVEFPNVLQISPVDAPIIKLFSLLAAAIGDDGIKATETGNLLRAVVRSIALDYLTPPEHAALTQFGPLRTEPEFDLLYITRLVAQQSGLIRMTSGRFTLTKVCKKLLARGYGEVYPRLLRGYASKINWQYFLSYGPDMSLIQQAFAFTLYLLDRYGSDWRPVSFYSDAIFTAFPDLLFGLEDRAPLPFKAFVSSYFVNRCLSKFCVFLGLAEAQVARDPLFTITKAVRKTSLLADAVRFHIAPAD